MCGVVGLIGGGTTETVRRMAETIAHRGPDGIRVEPLDRDRAQGALAHARLSIIDLEGGWQPLHAAGCTVIGNGEIYNYKELAEEYGLKGKLTTGSDFEPLLHLYAQQGAGLGGELQDALGLAPVERLDAERIAHQPHPPVVADQAEGVHAAQLVEGLLALLGIEVQEGLEVRAGGQLALEAVFLGQFLVVVDLAVADHRAAGRVVAQWRALLEPYGVG